MMKLRRMMTASRWIIAIALLTVTRSAAAQEPYPGLEAYVAKALQASKIPGIAIAIVRNDSVLYTKGFGVLKVGTSTAVNDQTLFEIGSSSKAFTATLVSMMVSDGKMQYDDLISKYLPDFKLADPVASAQVTIRDALEHRSGIGRGEYIWIDAGISREEVLHRVRLLKPESVFRSKWSYQNIMYLAAGQAAGKAGGSTWDDLVQTRIFTPLGMTSSLVTSRGMTNTNAATAHATERDSVIIRGRFDAEDIAPAGAILSNAHDMAQWLRFQLNDAVVNGKRLISTAAFKEIHTPQMLIPPGSGGGGENTLFSTYGMGWMVEDYRHELMWQHGGNTPGMTTAVGMLPEKKLGVVVLSNMYGAQLPAQIMHYIFDRQLGVVPREVAARAGGGGGRGGRGGAADSTVVPHVKLPPPLPLTAYVGTYVDSMYGEAVVSIQDGHLEFKHGTQTGPLEYWNAANFRWYSTGSLSSPTGPNAYIKFEVTPDNRVTGVYFGFGSDISLFGRKNAGGGRGGRAGRGGGNN